MEIEKGKRLIQNYIKRLQRVYVVHRMKGMKIHRIEKGPGP